MFAGLVPSKCCEGKGLFQACGWPLLPVSSHPLPSIYVQTSPFYEDTSPTGVELALVTLLYLIIKIKGYFFFKPSVYITPRSKVYLRLGLQHMNLKGIQFNLWQ